MNKTIYYSVWAGKQIGIFTSWEDCEKSVIGFPNNGYKRTDNFNEAVKLLFNGLGNYLKKECPNHLARNKKENSKLKKRSAKEIVCTGSESCPFKDNDVFK